MKWMIKWKRKNEEWMKKKYENDCRKWVRNGRDKGKNNNDWEG